MYPAVDGADVRDHPCERVRLLFRPNEGRHESQPHNKRTLDYEERARDGSRKGR